MCINPLLSMYRSHSDAMHIRRLCVMYDCPTELDLLSCRHQGPFRVFIMQ